MNSERGTGLDREREGSEVEKGINFLGQQETGETDKQSATNV